MTALTLFGGFASTVFWPLSQYLLDTIGWRVAFGIYAALHAVVCFPLHGVLIPKGETSRQIFLNAARWVPETDRLCYAIEQQAGKQTSLPVLLHVRKPGSKVAAAMK